MVKYIILLLLLSGCSLSDKQFCEIQNGIQLELHHKQPSDCK